MSTFIEVPHAKKRTDIAVEMKRKFLPSAKM